MGTAALRPSRADVGGTAAKYAGERPGEWAAIWVTVVLVTFSAKVGDDLEIVPILAMGAMVAGSLLLLMRVGMLAFVVLQHLFIAFIFELPVTLELSAWYGQPTVLFLLMVALLTSYGFYVSLGGRPMFGEAFLAE